MDKETIKPYDKNTKISDLPLSHFTSMYLKSFNFETVGEVIHYGIANLGNDFQRERNPRYELESIIQKEVDTDITADVDKKIEELAQEAYNASIASYPEYREVIEKLYPNANHIDGYIFLSYRKSLLRVYEGYLEDTNVKIRLFLVEFLTRLIDSLETNHLDNTPQYIIYKKMKDKASGLTKMSLYEKVCYFTSKETREYIRLKYKALIRDNKELSVRTKNNLRGVPYLHILDEGNFWGSSSSSSRPSSKMEDFYEELKSLAEKAIKLDVAYVKDINLQIKYPHLLEDQRQFVIDFKEKYGYLPMFYIIYKYVCSSESRVNKIINSTLGFEGKRLTREDVAKREHLSTERIRQIEVEGIDFGEKNSDERRFLEDLVWDNISHYEAFTKCACLTPYSDDYQKIVDAEDIVIKGEKIDRFRIFAEILISAEKFIDTEERLFELTRVKGIKNNYLLINADKISLETVTSIADKFASFKAKSTDELQVGYEDFYEGNLNENVKELIQELAKMFGYSNLDFYIKNSAAQQLQAFARFVRINHRFPLGNSNAEENRLKRWYNRVKDKRLSLSPSEMEEFESLCNYYKGLEYPQSEEEYDFLNKCNEYREYVIMKNARPTAQTEPELHSWYTNVQDNYSDYDDQRKIYFMELTDYINKLKLS